MIGASQLSSSVACVGKIGPRYHVYVGWAGPFGLLWIHLDRPPAPNSWKCCATQTTQWSARQFATSRSSLQLLAIQLLTSEFISHLKLFRPMIMFGDIVSNPYHIGALIRSGLIKALRSLVPEILEEAQLAIPENLKLSDSKDSLSIYLLQQSVVQIAAPSTFPRPFVVENVALYMWLWSGGRVYTAKQHRFKVCFEKIALIYARFRLEEL
ncbi:hypothetical protein K438DRAFT_1774214 [Mycena galopus ATCC 62051]|nr:hypothetical protein K438DRAFT_1774214 [Mycena galopus ATCC 62051]